MVTSSKAATQALPSTVEDWQRYFDDQFPEQVNVRIESPAGDRSEGVHFSAPCLTVVGLNAAAPVLLFWDGGGNKDFYVVPKEVSVVQTEPHLLLRLTRETERSYLFWPRPVPNRAASVEEKADMRAHALSQGPRYEADRLGETP